jgi:O-antigen/teichoic acid export membrane protein
MFNRSGTVYTILILIVSFIYPLFIIGDIDYITMVGLMIVVSVSGASEFFVVGRCRSLLYAHQRVYISSIIQASSIILSLGCALVLIKLNYRIIVVQLSISAVYIFRAIGLELYVRKEYPEYSNYKHYKPINKAVEKKNDALIHQITGLISTGSQSIVLSVIVGLEATSVFVVYNIVFSGLFSICSNINTAITPSLGRTIAVGDRTKLKKQFNIVEVCFFSIAAFIFAVCAVMIIPFVSLYTRGTDINYIDPLMALFFVVYTTCNVLKLPGQAIINASGHFKETRWRAIIEASSCLVLSIIFTLLWGRIGVLVGTSCSMVWRCIDIIVYANNRILNQSNKKSLFRLVRAFVVIFIIWFLFRQLDVTLSNYMQWVCAAMLVALITIFIILINVIVFDRSTIKR